MAKLVLATLSSGYLDVDKLNANLTAIMEWSDTVLSRNGALPNQMEADFDLNGHSLINLSPGEEEDNLVTFGQMQDYIQAVGSGLLVQNIQSFVAAVGQTAFTISGEYRPETNNLAVYVNGIRKFPVVDYVETSSTVFTFNSPLVGGENVRIVLTEFLGTVDLPTHTHTWTQITNKPDTATRWPTWGEVTGKPSTFPPDAHQHSTADITSGSGLADARRGVWVQAAQPTAGRVGELWFW
jgi:hypothetical protein